MHLSYHNIISDMKQSTKYNARFILISLLALSLPVIQGSPYILSDDRVRSLDAIPALGRGYSIMTNSFQSTCLKIDATTVPSFNYDYTFYDFTRSAEVEDELMGKISNTFGYYQVKKDMNEEMMRSRDSAGVYEAKHHVVSTMRIERFYSSMREEMSPMVENAQDILERQDYVGFFKACGPNYVRSIRRAQEVTTIFSFFSSSLDLAQEFASGLKASNEAGYAFDHDAFTKNKFKEITRSLEIKILGFGMGLNERGSGSLFPPTLDEYNNAMKFAYRAMTQSDDSSSANIGMVYGIEVIPWAERNISFLMASRLLESSIEIPLPRSVLARAYRNSDPTDVEFVSAARGEFRCKNPTYAIDIYGYCCEKQALYNTLTLEYNYHSPERRICRPIRSLEKSIVRNNMVTNAEFTVRLDSAIQHRFNQIASLEKCVSSANAIPDRFNYHYLRSQNDAKYDTSLTGKFTVAQLKQALDPFGDYSLVRHMGRELDEYMDMYYIPCVAALHGSNIGVSSDVDTSYFMAYPWHTHEECGRLSCLDDSMRWDRKEGGCVPSIISGNTHSGSYGGDDNCSHNVEGAATIEACKYKEADLSVYHQNVTSCWENTLQDGADTRIDYLMENFCMPSVTGTKASFATESSIRTDIESYC